LKKILLTGATSFLGSSLANKLLSIGYEVVALKKTTSLMDRIETISENLTLVNIDELEIKDIFVKHANISAIIHTATSYGRHGESLDEIRRINTEIPLQLLEAGTLAGVEVFINSDTTLNSLLNIYSLTKNQFVQWGRYFSSNQNIKFINMRLEQFYGHGESPDKFVTYILQSCMANKPELRLTSGEQSRDFIYIDDVIAAYQLVLEEAQNFNTQFTQFEVGFGSAISIKEVVKLAHSLTKSNTQLLFGAIPYRRDELMFSQANIAPLMQLGWACKVGLNDGLRLMINKISSKNLDP
jgi:CDP-paratose synthetase